MDYGWIMGDVIAFFVALVGGSAMTGTIVGLLICVFDVS